jgi:hypothetical protein
MILKPWLNIRQFTEGEILEKNKLKTSKLGGHQFVSLQISLSVPAHRSKIIGWKSGASLSNYAEAKV